MYWSKVGISYRLYTISYSRNSSNTSVVQELKFAGAESGKLMLLEEILKGTFEPPALIFVQSKERAGQLFLELSKTLPHIPARLMSSDLTDNAVRFFIR